MANNVWQDVDGDWQNILNWSLGAVPVATNNCIINEGARDIITNIDQSAVNDLTIRVGAQFSGTIGTAGTALKTGTGTTLYYGSALCKSFNFWPAACTEMVISQTHTDPYACYIKDGGITTLLVYGGPGVRLGAGLIFAASSVAHVYSGNLYIESGIDFTTNDTQWHQWGGQVDCRAELDDLEMHGGVWRHNGESTNNIVDLNVHGGLFYYNSKGATVTLLNVKGGHFDGSRDESVKTITNANIYAGWLNALNRQNTIAFTNTPVWYGGRYDGMTSATRKTPVGGGAGGGV